MKTESQTRERVREAVTRSLEEVLQPQALAAVDRHGGFARQLREAPVTAQKDRLVLAKVLLDVARADGRIATEEWDFLSQHAPDLLALLESDPQPLSRAELLQASPQTRETIFMLAWALALADRQLAEAERERLRAHAEGLGIAAERAALLRALAEEFLRGQDAAAGT